MDGVRAIVHAHAMAHADVLDEVRLEAGDGFSEHIAGTVQHGADRFIFRFKARYPARGLEVWMTRCSIMRS